MLVSRHEEGRVNAEALADLKASSARALHDASKQAQEERHRITEEADVKLQAAQRAGEKLQGQVQQLQEANGNLHKQLADAHGKVQTSRLRQRHKLRPC